MPNTTDDRASVVYTSEQYTIPYNLSFKPLGVKSLAKYQSSLNTNSLICLNSSQGKPIYAMEFTGDLGQEPTPKESTPSFTTQNLFGQKRLVYNMRDKAGKLKKYVILDHSIGKEYSKLRIHNNSDPETISKEIQLADETKMAFLSHLMATSGL